MRANYPLSKQQQNLQENKWNVGANNKNTDFSKKQWAKAMNKVHMTKADKMILSYNQDGDTNDESLMECDIYTSSHAKL